VRESTPDVGTATAQGEALGHVLMTGAGGRPGGSRHRGDWTARLDEAARDDGNRSGCSQRQAELELEASAIGARSEEAKPNTRRQLRRHLGLLRWSGDDSSVPWTVASLRSPVCEPDDSKKMVRLTGQRGTEGAALYHRASSSSGLHHGARAAPFKATRHRCGQAAASGAVASCRGALEKRSKRGSAQGGKRVAAWLPLHCAGKE
jgi:hypothetical protein